MKVNVTQKLKDYEGNPLKSEDGKKVLLRTILVNCLNYQDQEVKLTAEQKMRAYELSLKAMNNDEVNLKAEDVVAIKKGLDKASNALIYAQVAKVLEG